MNTGKFLVWAWVKAGNPDTMQKRKYRFVWGGNSIIAAVFQAWVAKGYSGCVKIEWRGTR